jgi:hypothetical protein
VRDRDLLAALKSRRIYSDEQVQRIADAAVRPETWSKLPLPVVDPAAVLAEFEELENGVTASDTYDRRKSAFWNLGVAPAQRPRTQVRIPVPARVATGAVGESRPRSKVLSKQQGCASPHGSPPPCSAITSRRRRCHMAPR